MCCWKAEQLTDPPVWVGARRGLALAGWQLERRDSEVVEPWPGCIESPLLLSPALTFKTPPGRLGVGYAFRLSGHPMVPRLS